MVRQACFSLSPGQQRLEGAGIGAAREQLVAIDQIEQRHRLAAQRMDDVPVVDDVAVLAAAVRRPAAAQASSAAWRRGSTRADRRRGARAAGGRSGARARCRTPAQDEAAGRGDR